MKSSGVPSPIQGISNQAWHPGTSDSINFRQRIVDDAIRRVHGTNVVVRGVYALDAAQARDYAAQRDIRAYESLDALLDDVDLIHCCAIVAGHEEVAVAALRRDKFVIVEKPLATAT